MKKNRIGNWLGGVALACMMAMAVGCGDSSAAHQSGRVAVVDIGRLLTATGAQQQINTALQQTQSQEQQNLETLQQQLGLSDKNTMPSTPQDAQKLLQAQQQMRQAIVEAQQRMQMAQMNHLEQFRAMVRPVAEQVAAANGCSVVIELNASILSYDPTSDITDQVLAELPRINQNNQSATSPLQPPSIPPGQPSPAMPLDHLPSTSQPSATAPAAGEDTSIVPQTDLPELR